MPDLPTGTVTFLFTDLEGSTTRWEQHRESMQTALARHDVILREAIEAHGGVVFKTMGDAFYAAFVPAPHALEATLSAPARGPRCTFALAALPQEQMMKRVGFMLKVRQEKLDEYKRHHENVWPEMLATLRATGWHNYTLFVRDDGLLFGYFETPDSLQDAQARMTETEINTKWQEFMAPYFESPNNARPDEMFVELQEVFHLD